MDSKINFFKKVNSADLNISLNAIQFLGETLGAMQKGIEPIRIDGHFLCKNSLSALVNLVQKRLFFVQWCDEEVNNNSIAVYFSPTPKLKTAIREFEGLQSIEISNPLPLHQKIIRASQQPCIWLKRPSAGINLDGDDDELAAGGEFDKFLLENAPFLAQL